MHLHRTTGAEGQVWSIIEVVKRIVSAKTETTCGQGTLIPKFDVTAGD